MGLGKSVQAIAACELLAPPQGHRTRAGVLPGLAARQERNGGEGRDCTLHGTARRARVFGARPGRLPAYREPAFFTIVNYEQVLGDAPDINEMLHSDMVVLDEAQRIKN